MATEHNSHADSGAGAAETPEQAIVRLLAEMSTKTGFTAAKSPLLRRTFQRTGEALGIR